MPSRVAVSPAKLSPTTTKVIMEATYSTIMMIMAQDMAAGCDDENMDTMYDCRSAAMPYRNWTSQRWPTAQNSVSSMMMKAVQTTVMTSTNIMSNTMYALHSGSALIPLLYCSARTLDLRSYVGYRAKNAG